ncbi:patatin-like protein 2 [Neltuma alba]|uniref:patatin-like protein 2 n=1 Tax=Neltuma alba TaxID=207710 RepID=UPI0010A4D80C|nr:patatin-like protein 2 [Prosopis alba]
MASVSEKVPSHSSAKYVTILSIDGGGVRGLIPAILLQFLETELQKYEKNARIVDYFDVIAGTSTGGLVATMLTAPHPNHKTRPLFTASQVVEFYKTKSPEIFPDGHALWKNKILDLMEAVTEP